MRSCNTTSRSPGRGGEQGSSPAYRPPGSQSPDVIDIDLEEMEPPNGEEADQEDGEERVGRVLLSDQLREVMEGNNVEGEDVDRQQDEEEVEDGQLEAEGVSPEI